MQEAKKTKTVYKKPGMVRVRKRNDEQSPTSQPSEMSKLGLPNTSTASGCSGATFPTKDTAEEERAHKSKELGSGQKVLSQAFPTCSSSISVRSSRTKKNYTVPVVRLNSSVKKAAE